MSGQSFTAVDLYRPYLCQEPLKGFTLQMPHPYFPQHSVLTHCCFVMDSTPLNTVLGLEAGPPLQCAVGKT